MNILSSLAAKITTFLVALHLVVAPVSHTVANQPIVIQPSQQSTTQTLPKASKPIFGTAVPNTFALVDTYLASGISKTDTSLTIANGTTKDGASLTGWTCLTLDANTPTVEYVCGTASSTSLTGLWRGVSLSNPNATSSALAFVHRRFASAQTTDYPTIQSLVRKVNGVDAVDTPLSYSNGTAGFITSSTQLASKGYVDTQVLAGAAPISTSVAGIGALATIASTTQGIATTTYNSQTYTLLPQNQYFNATSSATNLIPVTGPNGKLSQGFLDLTQNFSLTGSTTLASTTHSGTAVFNGLATFNGGISGIATTTWSQIGESILSVATNTITVVNLPVRNRLRIDFWTPGLSAGNASFAMTFNASTSANYGWRANTNGTESVNSSQTSIQFVPVLVNNANAIYSRGSIENFANQPHYMDFTTTVASTTANSAPDRMFVNGVWNSASQINSISILTNAGANGNFNASTTLTVYGSWQ